MKKIFLTPLLIFALTANAQVQTLTLKQAVTYALENKADAKKSRLEIENRVPNSGDSLKSTSTNCCKWKFNLQSYFTNKCA